jgi:Ca2+-binding RTX toxin-like protein
VVTITQKQYVTTFALTGSGSHYDSATQQNEIFGVFFTASLTATLRFVDGKMSGGFQRIVASWTSIHFNAGRDSSGEPYDEVRSLQESGNNLTVGDGTPSVSYADYVQYGIGDWIQSVRFTFTERYIPSANQIAVHADVEGLLQYPLFDVVVHLAGDFNLFPPGPNLSVTHLAFNGSTLSYDVQNTGNKTAASSASGVYLSTDPAIGTSDRLLATRGEGTLAAGDSETEKVLLSLPGNLDPGIYYLGVVADYRQKIVEGSESDNDSSGLKIVLGNNSVNRLLGTSGRDNIIGLGGNDTISAGSNNDMIVGGAGKDALTGGSGNDKFVFTAALSALTNVDRIADFSVPADTFVLNHTVFKTLAVGVLPSHKFHVGTGAHDATDRIIYNPANGSLLFDVDGLGGAAATRFAIVDPNLAITRADFLII